MGTQKQIAFIGGTEEAKLCLEGLFPKYVTLILRGFIYLPYLN